MTIHNFVLSYYNNTLNGVHIQKISSSDAASKPHTHDYFQIYYLSKGSLTHYVAQSSSVLNKGDMFIVPPGTQHYIETAPDSLFYTFSFMQDIFGETNDCNRIVVQLLESLLSDQYREIYPKITLPNEELLYTEHLMEQLLHCFHTKPLGHGEIIRAYAIILLSKFAGIYFAAMPQKLTANSEGNRQTILYCVQYIEHNFSENINVNDIARMCSMSKSCFCQLFHQITGYSFHKYLNKCRIEHAIRYILKGYKITSIYGLCGYNDFSTFYRNFKEITGVSPQQYRRTHLTDK